MEVERTRGASCRHFTLQERTWQVELSTLLCSGRNKWTGAEKEGKNPKIKRSTSDCTAGSYTKLFACKILVGFPFPNPITACSDRVWHDSLHYHLVGNSFITQLQGCSSSPPSPWWQKLGIREGRTQSCFHRQECVEKVCNLNPFAPWIYHNSKLCIQPSPTDEKTQLPSQ